MIPVLDSRRMKAADAAAIRGGVPSSLLMENAASALTDELVLAYPSAHQIAVVCGPGNNGGDGLAAARLLAGRGRRVSVFTLSDPDDYRGDAAENAERAQRAGLNLRSLVARNERRQLEHGLRESDVVVDA